MAYVVAVWQVAAVASTGVIYVGTSEQNGLARNEKYLYLLGRDVELLQDGNF